MVDFILLARNTVKTLPYCDKNYYRMCVCVSEAKVVYPVLSQPRRHSCKFNQFDGSHHYK